MTCREQSILLTCVFLFHLLLAKGQPGPPDYSITNYNSDNALPQNSINDMTFDRNGFLWLNTQMGIVRFDGRNFREYNTRNTPALFTDRCSLFSLARPSGTILIQPAIGLHRYLEVTDDNQLKEDSNLSANPYRCFRNHYVFTYSKLYHKWAAHDTGAVGRLFNRLDVNIDMVAVNETQAYVKRDQHYFYLDENTAGVRLLAGITGDALKLHFIIGDVYVFIDRHDRLYAYRAGLPQKITGSPRLMAFLARVDVTGPYPIQAAVKVLCDTGNTFLVLKGDILRLTLNHGVLDFETLAANTPIRNVNCLMYDEKYKIIYAGTATSGLYILKKQEFRRLFFSSDNFVINSLYAQVELPGGKILTSSGVLDAKNKINIPSRGSYDRPAFLRSSDGHIWYSSYGWLRRTDSGLHTAEKIINLGDISEVGVWTSAIIQGANGDILCGTNTPSRLFRIRGKEATLLVDARTSLNNAEIMSLLQVDTTHLWIGTSAGIYGYDLSTGVLRSLPGLEHATVRAIFKARDGSLWIGTYGQGFYKYYAEHFVKMPMDAMGNLASVHCFMEDKEGYLWLPTNRGLYRVAKNELDSYAAGGRDEIFYYYFDRSSGFSSNEFNGGCTPCGIKTADGHFSLPSLDGLIQFQPDSITMISPDHPIFIERQATDKKVLPAGNFVQDQDAGPLVFSISSPYYGNSANLHLEYSIPELDKGWHPVSQGGLLTLTGLAKGRYTLIIRKQEGYARYSYNTVRWTILPYWYETIWFRSLVALVIIGALLAVFYLRYTRQVRRAEELEQKVAERTAALSENNRVKEKMIAIILHDLRSPLRFLHMLATHIYEGHRTVAVSEREEMLRKFRNATRDLFEFTQDFVVWTSAQKEGFVIRQEPIVIREIVSEIISLYEPGADIYNNVVLNQVPGDIALVSDPHILKLLIRNLTDNATKYTSNGEIRIEASTDASSVRITITDTGRSMDKALVTKILNNTYQTSNETQGFGYKLILELLTKLQGRLSIDRPGETGNRITLIFANNYKNKTNLYYAKDADRR
ncbi:MAG TPA: two-component regulator propeller domain-containing protein [Puia sp.]|nr:two-component regulator propeller domain-containing protein [Puia sp.]